MTIHLRKNIWSNPTEPVPLWLLSASEVRTQFLIVAAGTRQMAFAMGDVEGVDERGPIYPVPGGRSLFLGAVSHRGRLVPLLSAAEVESPAPSASDSPQAAQSAGLFLDLGLQAGPLLLIVRKGEEQLALGFERFVGYCAPAGLAAPPPTGSPKWIKASGIIDEIPVLVVDTGALLDYCKGPVPTSRT